MAEENWSSNANEAVQIRLHHYDSSRDIKFHPTFTYPIFGDEETIFGYRGLRIALDFAADDLTPSLTVTSKAKYEAVAETQPLDIEATLGKWLPRLSEKADTIRRFAPPGELLHRYQRHGKNYGIWRACFTDPAVVELLKNMQIFVLFLIEGGSYIELSHPSWVLERWTLYMTYEIYTTPSSETAFSFVGYCTSYRLFFLGLHDAIERYDSSSPDFIFERVQYHPTSRQRISQFVILPPFQAAGHGSELYNTVYQYYLKRTEIKEITVEDPSEAFDELRDLNDLRFLRTTADFASLALEPSTTLLSDLCKTVPRKHVRTPTAALLPLDKLAQIQRETKIEPREFARVVEMQLLSKIPLLHRQSSRITRKDKANDINDRAYYYWRLLVKQRIYKRNMDQLAQLDGEERIEKVEEALAGVEQEYERRLKVADEWERKHGQRLAVAGSSEINGRTIREKRKIIDDDDDDDVAAEDLTIPNGRERKRSRMGSESS